MHTQGRRLAEAKGSTQARGFFPGTCTSDETVVLQVPHGPNSAVSTPRMLWLSSAGVALPAARRSSGYDMRRQRPGSKRVWLFGVPARCSGLVSVFASYVCKSRRRVGARSASTAPTGSGSGPPGGRRRARTRATRASPAFGARCPRAHVDGPSRPWRDLEGPRTLGFWRDLEGPPEWRMPF